MTPRQLVDTILSGIHAGTIDPDTKIVIDIGDGVYGSIGKAFGEPEDTALWLQVTGIADEPRVV
ncbi:MAG TPA: hypothetical protein VHR66_20585 [Gemmataceae bacterium]|nr:hypothetical protein [Gemmataceae bacterium]